MMQPYYCRTIEYYIFKCPPVYMKVKRLVGEPISELIQRYFGKRTLYNWMYTTSKEEPIFMIYTRHADNKMVRYYIITKITKEEYYNDPRGL